MSGRPTDGPTDDWTDRRTDSRSDRDVSGAKLLLGVLVMTLIWLGGCAETNKFVFRTLAGEAPGDKAAYVDISGANRLGRAPPAFREDRFRPTTIERKPAPTGAPPKAGSVAARLAQLGRDEVAIETGLADRDDELQFRRRSLVQHLQLYTTSTKGLKLAPGDPLPANDKAFADQMAGIRENLSRVRVTLGRISAMLPRLEQLASRSETLENAAQQMLSKSGASAAERSRLETVKKDAAANRATILKMLEVMRGELARMIEYVSGQKTTLDTFQSQVAKANNQTSPRRAVFQ